MNQYTKEIASAKHQTALWNYSERFLGFGSWKVFGFWFLVFGGFLHHA